MAGRACRTCTFIFSAVAAWPGRQGEIVADRNFVRAQSQKKFSHLTMKLAKWSDGYVLDTDPRREDPLYYYMQEGAWGSTIGFEVDPPYEEHKAIHVCIRVFLDPAHKFREAEMDKTKRQEMYCRVISELLGRFGRWLRVKLQSSYLSDIMLDGSLATIFKAAGFSPAENTQDEITWTKV